MLSWAFHVVWATLKFMSIVLYMVSVIQAVFVAVAFAQCWAAN